MTENKRENESNIIIDEPIEKSEKSSGIKENELEVIREEIRLTKLSIRSRRSPTYTKIFKNILIGIVTIIYIYLLTVGYEAIGFRNYFNIIKYGNIVLAIIGILIMERGYHKKSLMTISNGLETIFIGGLTLVIVNLFNNHYTKISSFEVYSIIIVTLYFLLKSVFIAINDYKNNIYVVYHDDKKIS